MNTEHLLDYLKIVSKFRIKDPYVQIKLKCVICYLERVKQKTIRSDLQDWKDNLDPSEQDYELKKHYLEHYIDSPNNLSYLKRHVMRKGVLGLYRKRDDFLIDFLNYAPTPQNVRLPFFLWDEEILGHYLSLGLGVDIKEETLKQALSIHHMKSVFKNKNNLPVLSNCKQLFSSSINSYFYIIFMLKNDTGKTNKYMALRLALLVTGNTEANCKIYDYVPNENIPDIYDTLERCLPKKTDPYDVTFFIINTEAKHTLFKKSFLNRKSLPKSSYFFLHKVSNLEDMATCIASNDLLDLYQYVKSSYDAVRKYVKNNNYRTSKITKSQLEKIISSCSY